MFPFLAGRSCDHRTEFEGKPSFSCVKGDVNYFGSLICSIRTSLGCFFPVVINNLVLLNAFASWLGWKRDKLIAGLSLFYFGSVLLLTNSRMVLN